MRPVPLLVTAALAAALATASVTAAPDSAVGAPAAADGSLVARVLVPGWARRAPATTAVPLVWLDRRTAWSGRPAVLLVTGRRRDRQGRRWVRVLVPLRPNGSAGWVPERYVRLGVTPLRIVVRRRARRLEVWRGRRLVHRWRAGVGRVATPTPLGTFAVQDPVRTLPAWRPVYGAHTITLTAYSAALEQFMGGDGLIAIHGGGAAARVGRAASNGCIVLAPRPLRVLARLAAPGTPVRVLP